MCIMIEVFLYVIGMSNIMLTWNYVNFLNIKGKHNFKQFYYTKCRNTNPKGRSLMKMYRVVPQTKRVNFSFMVMIGIVII